MDEAIILAGGLGTRLRSAVNDRPKSMALINNRPFLEYLMDYLSSYGVNRVVLSVGYQSGLIVDHFGNRYKNMSIDYATEESPLGTGGAVFNALKKIDSDHVVICNGDSIIRADLAQMTEFHLRNDAMVTFAIKEMTDSDRYGTVELDNDQRILRFVEKKPVKKGLINTGLYIFNTSAVKQYTMPEKFSLETEFFEKYLSEALFYGFVTDTYFIDIGIPGDYSRAQTDFRSF